MTNKEIVIVCIGPNNVGKTTYINRCETGEFEVLYIPTTKIVIYDNIKINTTNGIYKIKLLDVPECEINNIKIDHIDLCWAFSTCTIFKKTIALIKTFKRFFPKTGIFHIITKSDICIDILNNTVKEIVEIVPKGKGICISSKSNYNYEEPWVYSIRQFTNDNNIKIIE